MSLDDGDILRGSDNFKFFRGNNTDKSKGVRDVPLDNLVSFLNIPDNGLVAGASKEDVEQLKDNVGALALTAAVEGGWTWFNMIDGVADVFTDETGVDTGAATNANYVGDGDYYTSGSTASATLLIHSDTTNGSTTFIDSAGSKTITDVGGTIHSTAQQKFGTSSIFFDGTNDELTLADSVDWDLGLESTIDMWIRPNRLADDAIISRGDAHVGGTDFGWELLIVNSTRVDFYYSTDGTNRFNRTFTMPSALQIGVWQHIALITSGGQVNVALDGVLATPVVFAVPFASSELLRIGTEGGGTKEYSGYIDEIRLLKGTAAWWSSDFDPPTAPYVITAGNMTLPSIEFDTVETAVAARMVILYEFIDSAELNTDLIFELSRDESASSDPLELSLAGNYRDNINYATTSEINLTDQTVGSNSINWTAETLNLKDIRIHGAYLQWR